MVEQVTDDKVDFQVRRYPLASRWKRLVATLIDSLLMTLLLAPFATILGIDEVESLLMNREVIPIVLLLKMHMGLFVCLLVLNGWLLFRYGQTVGKRLLKIAIATDSYQIPDFNRLIMLRYFPFFLVRAIPGLNLLNLVDTLFIFREDRRCLHDIVAGTKVIDVSQAG
jgi:uncharacterized RDD family membrane protein YckC